MFDMDGMDQYAFDLSDLLNNIPGGVAIYKFAPPFEILYFNQGVCNLSGHTKEEYFKLVQQNPLHLVYEADRCSLEEEIFNSMKLDQKINYTFRIHHKNGSLVWVHLSANNVQIKDGTLLHYALFMDVSDERKMQNLLSDRIDHDSLTSALNRFSFEEKVESNLTQQDAPCAFIMLDIDNFKNINDQYGHVVGDDALRLVSRHLIEIFGIDNLIARMGGDEFAIFVTPKHIPSLLDLMDEIANLKLDDKMHYIHLSCSMGVAQYPQDGRDFHSLYTNADKALLFAKNNGKNQYQIFSESMEPNNRMLFQNMEWLLDEGGSAIYICDAENYELLYLNKIGRKMAGLDDTSYLGRKCYECLMHLDAPCPFCKMDEMSVDSFIEREFQVPKTKQDLILKGKLIKWNGIRAHVEFITDNRGRASACRELKKIAQDLQALMKYIPNAIAILEVKDENLRVSYVNKGFYTLVNCPKEHFDMYLGPMDQWVHPSDVSPLYEKIQRSAKEHTQLNCSFQMRLFTGQYVRMKLHATLLQQEDEQITMYASFSIA